MDSFNSNYEKYTLKDSFNLSLNRITSELPNFHEGNHAAHYLFKSQGLFRILALLRSE